MPVSHVNQGCLAELPGATTARAPQTAVLFDEFHIMRHLGDALDKVRKTDYARLSAKDRRDMNKYEQVGVKVRVRRALLSF